MVGRWWATIFFCGLLDCLYAGDRGVLASESSKEEKESKILFEEFQKSENWRETEKAHRPFSGFVELSPRLESSCNVETAEVNAQELLGQHDDVKAVLPPMPRVVANSVAQTITFQIEKRQTRRKQEADEECKRPRSRRTADVDPIFRKKVSSQRLTWRTLDQKHAGYQIGILGQGREEELPLPPAPELPQPPAPPAITQEVKSQIEELKRTHVGECVYKGAQRQKYGGRFCFISEQTRDHTWCSQQNRSSQEAVCESQGGHRGYRQGLEIDCRNHQDCLRARESGLPRTKICCYGGTEIQEREVGGTSGNSEENCSYTVVPEEEEELQEAVAEDGYLDPVDTTERISDEELMTDTDFAVPKGGLPNPNQFGRASISPAKRVEAPVGNLAKKSKLDHQEG